MTDTELISRYCAQPNNTSFGLVEQYLDRDSWRIKENANFSYSWSGLQSHITDHIMADYTLAHMPINCATTHKSGAIHIHNLNSFWIPYCHGGDLLKILTMGIRSASVKSNPAKHFNTIVDHIVNYLYMSQLEFAGAQAVSDVNTLLAPFVYYDHLSYHDVKQTVQRLIFNLNFESRQAFQTPFTNISLNNGCPEYFKNIPALIGGIPLDRTYAEFQVESNMILRAICECLLEMDAGGRPFTFPIPTLNITRTTDFDSDEMESVASVSGKLGSFYFMNYRGTNISENTVRAMCCRLMLDMEELPPTSGLWNFSGGTGSVGVVSLNMARLGYISHGEREFFDNLHELLRTTSEYLLFKDHHIRQSLDHGLLPFSRYYGLNMDRYFRTIGVIGLNEMCENFLHLPILNPEAVKFTKRVLEYIREFTQIMQRETQKLWNLELTPGEGSSFRLARKDREQYDDIYTLGSDDAPYYSTLIVPSLYDVPMAKIEIEEQLLSIFTGGTVSRNFIGEVLDARSALTFIKWLSNRNIPYFDLTATFGICNHCDTYLNGLESICQCGSTNIDKYSRVVGYYRSQKKVNRGKRQEWEDRKLLNKKKLTSIPALSTSSAVPSLETGYHSTSSANE